MRGPLLLLAALGLFALLDANNKLLAGAYGVAQVVMLRQAVMLALLGGGRLVRPGLGGGLRTAHPWLHLARALGMLGSAFGFFQALREVPLAEAYLVYFTAPFMTLALSALVLREVPRRAVWGWSALGFAGVLLAMAPGLQGGGSLLAYGYALFGTASYAVVLVISRSLRDEAGFARLILWSSLPGALLLLPFALQGWVQPDGTDLLRLLANGVLAGAATLCVAAAFRIGSIAQLAPMEFSGLIWALLLDWAIWGLWPHATMLAGAAIVIFACVMSQRAEGRRP